MAAIGFDQGEADLLAHPRHQRFHGVGVTVAIAGMNMFEQFALRHRAAPVHQEIRQQPIFQHGEVQRPAINGRRARTGVEFERAGRDK